MNIKSFEQLSIAELTQLQQSLQLCLDSTLIVLNLKQDPTQPSPSNTVTGAEVKVLALSRFVEACRAVSGLTTSLILQSSSIYEDSTSVIGSPPLISPDPVDPGQSNTGKT